MSKIAFFSNIFCIFSNVLFWPTNAKNITFRPFNSTQSGPARLYTSYSPQRPRQRPPHSGTFRFSQNIFKKIDFFDFFQSEYFGPKVLKMHILGTLTTPKHTPIRPRAPQATYRAPRPAQVRKNPTAPCFMWVSALNVIFVFFDFFQRSRIGPKPLKAVFWGLSTTSEQGPHLCIAPSTTQRPLGAPNCGKNRATISRTPKEKVDFFENF